MVNQHRNCTNCFGYVYIVFLSLFFVFGNNILQLNLIGEINCFYVFMFVSYVHIAYLILFKRVKKPHLCISRLLNLLFVIGLCFVFLSLLEYQRFFSINGLSFSNKYIFRQAYFIFMIPIGYDILYSLVHLKIKRINNLTIVLLVLLLCVCSAFDFLIDKIMLWYTIPVLCAFLCYRNRKPLYYVLYFIVLFTMRPAQTTYIFGDLILTLFLIFDRFLNQMTKKDKVSAYWLFWFFAPALMLIFILMMKKMYLTDPNSQWRMQYWLNEFNILKKTFFFGVGFGTGYCDSSILGYINNPSVFLRQGPFDQVSLYIAQHNSFLNVFYRMGILTGIIFLVFNLKVFKNFFFKKKMKYTSLAFSMFLYGVLIIFFNPGLESPRFCLIYLVGLLASGFILKNQMSFLVKLI